MASKLTHHGGQIIYVIYIKIFYGVTISMPFSNGHIFFLSFLVNFELGKSLWLCLTIGGQCKCNFSHQRKFPCSLLCYWMCP